jgi:hypothetical protein
MDRNLAASESDEKVRRGWRERVQKDRSGKRVLRAEQRGWCGICERWQ